MAAIRSSPLPADALTQRYRESGAYTDCYFAEVPRPVSLAEYVEAFYTTPLFKLERWILRAFVMKPSTDAEAREFARGERDAFAAWSLEDRVADQLLACDFMGRTRSWFMVAGVGRPGATRLYFGSAVVKVRDPGDGRTSLGPVHGRLLGFHRLYSRMLLSAAARKLARG